MLKKICGCGKIIPQSIRECDKCSKRQGKEAKKSYKTYKNRRPDSEEQEFYNNDKDWKFTKKTVNQRDFGMCRLCKKKHRDIVHHIEPLKEDWSLRINMDNLICLCNRCHFYVHKKYNKDNKTKLEMQEKLSELVKQPFIKG